MTNEILMALTMRAAVASNVAFTEHEELKISSTPTGIHQRKAAQEVARIKALTFLFLILSQNGCLPCTFKMLNYLLFI